METPHSLGDERGLDMAGSVDTVGAVGMMGTVGAAGTAGMGDIGGAVAAADLNELLARFTRVRGVGAALVVGQDGLVLQSVTAPGADDADLDILGALAASGLVSTQEIGRETNRGQLRQGIYEYDNGVIVVEPLDSAILVVVTDAVANLGLLRLQARRVHPDLEAALNGL